MEKELIVKIGATIDGLKKGLEESQSRLEKFGERATEIGQNLSLAITTPLTAFAGVSAKSFGTVEKGLREINTLLGLTGEEAEKNLSIFTKEANDISKELGILQSNVVPGLYNAISAGVPNDNVFDFIRVAGKAAIGGVTDINTAVDGLTSIVNAFNLDFAETEKVADSVFAAVQGGKTTFEEIASSIFNVAPAAAAAKVAFTEVNAAIATLTASGTPTSVATTQIRAALTGLQRPSEDLDRIFQKLGFQSAQFAVEQKGLGFALDAVVKAAQGNNGELQKLLGSVEAVSAANVIAGTGAEKFAQELERQSNAAGSAAAAFDEVDQSFSRQLERAFVALSNFSIVVGQRLAPALEKVADLVEKLANKFSEIGPVGQTVIVVLGAIAAAIGPLLIGIGGIISIIPTLTAGLATVKTAILALSGPIGIAVAAIAILVGQLINLNSNLEESKRKIQEIKDSQLEENFKNIKNEVEELTASYQKNNTELSKSEARQKALNAILKSYESVLDNVRKTDAGNLNRIDLIQREIDFIKSLQNETKSLTNELQNLSNTTKLTFEEFSELTDLINENTFAKWSQDARIFNQELEESISLANRLQEAAKRVVESFKIQDISLDIGFLPVTEVSQVDTSRESAFLVGLKKIREEFETFANDFEQRTSDFVFTINNVIENGLANAFSGLGNALGEALATGQSVISALGNALLNSLSAFLGDLGQQLIAFGVAGIAFASLIEAIKAGGPLAIPAGIAAIAAGTALVAISSAIRTRAGRGLSGGASAPLGVGTNSSLEGTGDLSRLNFERNFKFEPLIIEGDKIRYVVAQSNRYSN